MVDWCHKVQAGAYEVDETTVPDEDSIKDHREHIEPWLAALLQAEHLNLLVGSGLTTALAHHTNAPIINMSPAKLGCQYNEMVQAAVTRCAVANGRRQPNLEDVVRVLRELVQGLAVFSNGNEKNDEFLTKAKSIRDEWNAQLNTLLVSFLRQILETEAEIRAGIQGDSAGARAARRLLGSFLLTFASRTATRERLHIFTTNYDRLIEFGADLIGLRIIDRFVGELEPIFRASRLGIDMHYNPPGIRGEPRYLEGVIRFSKLHGSIDWRQESIGGVNSRIVRAALPFGAAQDHSGVPKDIGDGLMIYPNPAKDVETLEYPYASFSVISQRRSVNLMRSS